MRTCSICPEKHFGHGYCNRHYVNWRRHSDPLGTMSRGLPLKDMLLSRIPLQPDNDCWVWGGTLDSQRKYGRMKWQGKRHQAHRLMFFATHGYWPMEARHTCDNPPCCNPDHLIDGSRQDNVDDRVQRGRSARRLGTSNPNARYTAEQITEVRRLWGIGMTGDQITEQTGVGRSTVYRNRSLRTAEHAAEVTV